MVVQELLRLKVELRKLKYREECIRNGDISEVEDEKERQEAILALQNQLHVLEEQSTVPTIRQSIHSVMRKCLVYENWEQLHCLYVAIFVRFDIGDRWLPPPACRQIDLCRHLLVHEADFPALPGAALLLLPV